MKKIIILLIGLIVMSACTNVAEPTLIQACPTSWWENAEPCDDGSCDGLERSYMTIDGERYYESEVDVEWVQANCDVVKEIAE